MTDLTLVEGLDDALAMLEWLARPREFLAFDIETQGLSLGAHEIRLVQFGDTERGWALDYKEWKGVVRTVFDRYDRPLVAHNLAFDGAFLKRDGIHIPQRLVHDSMIMCHLVEPRYAIGLKAAAYRYVSRNAWLGKGMLAEAFHGGGWNFATIPVDHPSYWVYSVMDTTLTSALASKLWPKVRDNYRRIYEVEMGALHVLRDARLRGMQIDVEYVERTRTQLMVDLEGLRPQIPCSPSKDREVVGLLQELGVRNGRSPHIEDWWHFRTDSGAVSVDDDALATFEGEFPVIAPLREYRKKSKIVNSYLSNLLDLHVGGVIRPHIKQVAARTGRMSVTEPALQTLPRGRVVRDAFVAREGEKMILADFEQAEARVMASYAGCAAMIDSFNRGEDQHQWVAALCYHEGDMDVVTPAERQIAKGVGYANIYGAGPAKIAAQSGAPLPVVEAFLQRYNRMFPEIGDFKARLINTVRDRWATEGDGYVTTVLGRRLPVDEDKLFTGVNYLMQSCATADLLKLKLIELDAAGLGPYIRLPVHDEIIFEAPDEHVDEAQRIIDAVLPETKLFACPMTIEQDVVERWGDHFEKDPDKRFHWTGVPE